MAEMETEGLRITKELSELRAEQALLLTKLEAAEALLASKEVIIDLLQNSARLQTEAHGTPPVPAPAPAASVVNVAESAETAVPVARPEGHVAAQRPPAVPGVGQAESHAPRTVRYQAPARYDGSEDKREVEYFIDECMSWMKYGGRDPMPLEQWGLHASTLLQGEALLHFQSVIRGRTRESIQWDEFVERMTKAYHRSGEDFAARVKLHAMKQKPDQDVNSLVREFKQLLGRMRSRPDEQTLIFSFVNMLKAGLRKQVLLRCPQSGAWDSLSAVTDAAVLVESDALRASLVDAPRGDANRQSVRNKFQHQSEGSADGSLTRRSRADRVGGPRAEMLRSNKRSRDAGTGGLADQGCFKCGQLGHRQASCPRNSGGAGPSGHRGGNSNGGRHGGRHGNGGGRHGGSLHMARQSATTLQGKRSFSLWCVHSLHGAAIWRGRRRLR